MVRLRAERASVDFLGVAFLTVAVCLLALSARAATYYVDGALGDDGNSGLSVDDAWGTLDAVDAESFGPGDTILFRRDLEYRGVLRVSGNGNPGNPISVGAYGEGAQPIINGAALIQGWAWKSGNVYESVLDHRAEQVFFNGVRGMKKSTEAELVAHGDWMWQSDVLRVYHVGPPQKVEASVDLFTVLLLNQRWIELRDLHVRFGLHPIWMASTRSVTLENLTVDSGAGFAGVFMRVDTSNGGRFNTIRNCRIFDTQGDSISAISDNPGSGIYIFGGGVARSNTIEGNELYNNLHEGISILDSADNVIRGNQCHNNAEPGIRLALPGCTGNIVEYNRVWGNCFAQDDRFGIDLIAVGNDNEVRYNRVYSQQLVASPTYGTGGIRFDGVDGSGTMLTESTGNTAYYNVVYDEYIGISVFNFSNVHLYNNTIVNTNAGGIVIGGAFGQTTANTVVKNNIVDVFSGPVLWHENATNSTINRNFYQLGPFSLFAWETGFYPYATYRSISGQDGDSFRGNPGYVDSTVHDYRMTAASAPVDRGVLVGLTEATDGVPVPQGPRPDIGAYEYIEIVSNTEGEGEGIGEGEGEGEGEGDGEGEGIGEGEGEDTGEGEEEGEGETEGIGEGEGEGEGEGDEPGVIDPLQPDFAVNVQLGQAPLVVQFTDLTVPPDKAQITSWLWDFGDGANSTEQHPAHEYALPGLYDVTLTVTTDSASETRTKHQLVRVAAVVPAPGGGMLLLLVLTMASVLALRRRATDGRATPAQPL